MSERSIDWLRQAESDLEQAKSSLREGRYEWACFASQQAAEKGLRSVYEKMNRAVKGHSILGLINGLSDACEVPDAFYSYARVLSRYYIETRYPNGFPEGAPLDYFDENLAKEAVSVSEKILGWCRDYLNRIK
jgi:HEPN domain-containing protein